MGPHGDPPGVRRLALLQIDPTAAIAPSADLVAWSRLGSSYRPEHLKRAVEVDRTLFERDASIRPRADLGLELAGASEIPSHERRRIWAARERPVPPRHPGAAP